MRYTQKFNPKKDIVFHLLFGRKGNEDLLIDLLQSILNIEIYQIEVDLNTQLETKYIQDKMGILDIRAKINDGQEINIEMQVINKKNMIKRTLYYVTKLYSSQLKVAEDYINLKKTIAINILDFDLIKSEKYHTKWNLRENEENEKLLTDDIEIHFIEIPKFIRKKESIRENLQQWLYFLDNTKMEMIDMSKTMNKNILKASNQVKVIYSNWDSRGLEILLERKRLDELWDKNERERQLVRKYEREKQKFMRQARKKLKEKYEEKYKKEYEEKYKKEYEEKYKKEYEEKYKKEYEEKYKKEYEEKYKKEYEDDKEEIKRKIIQQCKKDNLPIEKILEIIDSIK